MNSDDQLVLLILFAPFFHSLFELQFILCQFLCRRRLFLTIPKSRKHIFIWINLECNDSTGAFSTLHCCIFAANIPFFVARHLHLWNFNIQRFWIHKYWNMRPLAIWLSFCLFVFLSFCLFFSVEVSEGSQLKPQKSEINQKKFPEEFWQFPRRNLRKPRKLSPKFELQWMYSDISQRVFLPVHITSMQ